MFLGKLFDISRSFKTSGNVKQLSQKHQRVLLSFINPLEKIDFYFHTDNHTNKREKSLSIQIWILFSKTIIQIRSILKFFIQKRSVSIGGDREGSDIVGYQLVGGYWVRQERRVQSAFAVRLSVYFRNWKRQILFDFDCWNIFALCVLFF